MIISVLCVVCDDDSLGHIVYLVRMASCGMLAHIVTTTISSSRFAGDPSEPDTRNDGRNGAVVDTNVLSKITTKRSFTLLWHHLSEPSSSPRFYHTGLCVESEVI